jgi:methylated-DNA-[protein]-cysteine S-methyltransferase
MRSMTALPAATALGTLDTPVGQLSVAVSGEGLCALSWGTPSRLAERYRLAADPDSELAEPVLAELAAYFRGEVREFAVPVDWRLFGPVQRQVLGTLFETVRYGESVTYGELAGRSGAGVPPRGIGAIMGSNPLPVVVPCHRVLAANGLGGYSGGSGSDGLAVKRWLLTLEGVLPPTLDGLAWEN